MKTSWKLWWVHIARLQLRLLPPVLGLAAALLTFGTYTVLAQAVPGTMEMHPFATVTSHGEVVPWGLWLMALISSSRDILVSLASMALAALATTAPFFVRTLINEFLTQNTIEHAVDGAIARVDGVLKGKAVTLPVAQGILLDAERYVIQHEPQVQKRLGEYLIPRLQAQMVKAGVAPEQAMSPPLPGI